MLRRLFTRGLIQQHRNPVESFHAVEFKPHSVPVMLICSMRGTSAEKTLLLTIFGWQQLVRQVIRGYQHHSYLLTTGVLSAQLLLVGLGCLISAFCLSSPVKQLNALMKIWLPLHKYMWAYMCLNDWPWVLCTAVKHKWKRASPGKNELPVLLYNDIIARVSQRSAWLAPCPWAIHPDTLG